MKLKIGFPNPWEFQGKNAEQFFVQMRIALKASEKTYQEYVKSLTSEEEESIWLGFELSALEGEEKSRKKLEEIDPDYDLRQLISLTIQNL